MATGRTHQIVTGAAAVIVATAVPLITGDIRAGLLAGGGCLFGLFVHPDRDLPVARIDYQIARHTLGLGLIFAILWYPYARAVPHRHWFSHAPLVSTIGRIAYLALWAMLAGYVLRLVWPGAVVQGAAWLRGVSEADWLWMAAGLALSDVLHWLFDM